jgi:hypothetical protein
MTSHLKVEAVELSRGVQEQPIKGTTAAIAITITVASADASPGECIVAATASAWAEYYFQSPWNINTFPDATSITTYCKATTTTTTGDIMP